MHLFRRDRSQAVAYPRDGRLDTAKHARIVEGFDGVPGAAQVSRKRLQRDAVHPDAVEKNHVFGHGARIALVGALMCRYDFSRSTTRT